MMENQILKTKLEIDNVKKKQMIGDGRVGGGGMECGNKKRQMKVLLFF